MKKFITLSLIFSFSALATSIIPQRIVYEHYDTYRGKLNPDGTYKVRGTRYSPKRREFTPSTGPYNIDSKTYLNNLRLGDSVFRAFPENDSMSQGTAFHIGNGYVLTNFHVYHTKFRDKACSNFRIKSSNPKYKGSFRCEKKIRCKKSLDYCLIKMKDKNKQGNSLSGLPALKLNLGLTEQGNKAVTTVIGNAMAHGVQASSGIGIIRYGSSLHVFSPTWGGNSGSPVFNHREEVIGVIKKQSPKHYQSVPINAQLDHVNHPYNVAIPIYAIHRDLKNLHDVPQEVLEIFK